MIKEKLSHLIEKYDYIKSVFWPTGSTGPIYSIGAVGRGKFLFICKDKENYLVSNFKKVEENTNIPDSKFIRPKARLSESDKIHYQLSTNLKEILVGKLLGDAHMRRFNISEDSKSNARVIFLQSLEQSEFIYHLFGIFKDYSISSPKVHSSLIKETGNFRHNISFGTRTLPCFNEFYNLFYKNRLKVVPENIEELLTEVSLAY